MNLIVNLLTFYISTYVKASAYIIKRIINFYYYSSKVFIRMSST